MSGLALLNLGTVSSPSRRRTAAVLNCSTVSSRFLASIASFVASSERFSALKSSPSFSLSQGLGGTTDSVSVLERSHATSSKIRKAPVTSSQVASLFASGMSPHPSS